MARGARKVLFLGDLWIEGLPFRQLLEPALMSFGFALARPSADLVDFTSVSGAQLK
jgi:hypothetical protein